MLGESLRPRRNRRPKVSRDLGDLRSAGSETGHRASCTMSLLMSRSRTCAVWCKTEEIRILTNSATLTTSESEHLESACHRGRWFPRPISCRTTVARGDSGALRLARNYPELESLGSRRSKAICAMRISPRSCVMGWTPCFTARPSPESGASGITSTASTPWRPRTLWPVAFGSMSPSWSTPAVPASPLTAAIRTA
jgi:hypothetical protein